MALDGAAIAPDLGAGNEAKPNVRLSVRSDAANKVPKNVLTNSKLSETALTCSEGEVLQLVRALTKSVDLNHGNKDLFTGAPKNAAFPVGVQTGSPSIGKSFACLK